MDEQEDSVSQKCEEAWFDAAADPCGKEFELPDISTPMLSPNRLLFSQSHQLDSPAVLENAFALDMNNILSLGWKPILFYFTNHGNRSFNDHRQL